MNLSGLSAVYPGYSAQESATATTEQNQAAAQEAALKLLGAQVLGRAFTDGQPSQGPQPPAPGQPSVPNQPPPPAMTPPVQGGSPAAAQPPLAPRAPPMAQGQPGAPPSAGGSGLPEMNLQTLTQRILATSPQVRNHPEILMAALERAAPILDRQSKEDLYDLRKEMQTKSLEQRSQIANAQLDAAKAYHAQVSADRQAAESGRQGRFDVAEKRRQASAMVRDDQGYQRLQLATAALAQRAEISGNRDDLARWRAAQDAEHKYATEFIQANSALSNLSDEDKKALLDERRASTNAAIAAMKSRLAPTGGTTPPGAPAAPKVEGQAPAAKPIPFDVRQQYDAAIAAGKPKDALIKRLQESGYTTEGL